MKENQVTVNFRKKHTSGIFKGATQGWESLTFVSLKSARNWIDGCKKHSKRNGWKFFKLEIV